MGKTSDRHPRTWEGRNQNEIQQQCGEREKGKKKEQSSDENVQGKTVKMVKKK